MSGGARARLRSPSDLAAEAGRPPRAAQRPGREGRSWPESFVADRADRAALLVLLSLAALTPRRLQELAMERGSASACLAAVRAGEAGSEADRWYAWSIDPAEVAAQAGRAGARLVAVHDREYPAALLDLFDPPAGLFVSGRALEDLPLSVAIVGARRCSAGGRDTASSLGSALARSGVCVVSGGARGIDGAAHRGALDAGGVTVAVLGCGVDVAYPAENRDLLASIRDSGALVSEYPPGTPAEPFRFPARNRIVAALATAVVVVEGARGSGSMITAEHAMEIGRDVFGVPGSVSSPLSDAPHVLIRDGAGLIRHADDLLHDLGLPSLECPAAEAGAASDAGLSLTADERTVWEALLEPFAPDRMALDLGLPLPRVMGALVGLEIRGMVRQTGGRYERRIARSVPPG